MTDKIEHESSGCSVSDIHSKNKKIGWEDLHFNFVFFFAGEDYWKSILGNEIYKGAKSRAYDTAFEGNAFLRKLFHYHWAYSLNAKVKLPFKSLWFKRMYEQRFNNDLPLCFVYVGGNSIRFDGGWCEYVRKRDSRNKQVILEQDLISKKINYPYAELLDKVDLAITYDLGEAQSYGIHYYPEVTYDKPIPEPVVSDIKYDLFFIGYAKDRLDDVHQIAKVMVNAGVRIKFLIVGAPKTCQEKILGVEYVKAVPYEKSIALVLKSKCILEVNQKGSNGTTNRMREAISYRRRFLTDYVKCDKSLFNEGQLSVFESARDIDIDFLKSDFDPNDYEPVVNQNPLIRLYDIQEQLEKSI